MTLSHDGTPSLPLAHMARRLDGELDAPTALAFDRHVQACPDCRELYARLAGTDRALSAALERADFTPPDHGDWDVVRAKIRATVAREAVAREAGRPRRRAGGRTLAAAALVLALAGAAVASPPVRQWVARRFRPAPTPAAPAASAAPAAPAAGSAAVRFQVEGATLELVLDHAQTAGRIEVWFSDDRTAGVAVVGGDADGLVVGDAAVRVTNGVASTDSYRVDAPAAVQRVAIRVPGRAPIEVDRPEGQTRQRSPVVVELGPDGDVRNPAGRDDGGMTIDPSTPDGSQSE